jgi:hypothetical protein
VQFWREERILIYQNSRTIQLRRLLFVFYGFSLYYCCRLLFIIATKKRVLRRSADDEQGIN